MRGSHYLRHARTCSTCGNGRLCAEGKQILTTAWTRTVPAVPVSQAGTTRIDVHALVIGSAL